MKLLIKQRVFSWSDSYDIYDEAGNSVFFVRAEIFSLGHKLHVYDKQDREVGVVRERILTFMPVFDVEIGGREVGTIKKQFTLFHPRYEVDFSDWSVQGDFMGWDYNAYKGDRLVMHISKELFHWGDTYVLDIPNTEDLIPGLMLALAIDAANCQNG